MKKFPLVFIILLSYKSYCQDSILLAAHYKSLTNYYQDVSQSMHIVVRKNDNDSLPATNKDTSDGDSMKVDQAYLISGVMRTGRLNDDHEIPIEFEYFNAKNQDSAELIPAGVKLFGKVTKNNQRIYDSVSQTPGNEMLGPSILKTTQSLMSQISFPDKMMAVGDSFTKESPLTFNVGGINVTMKYVQTYKLVSATKDSANFALNIVYIAQVGIDDLPGIKLSGGGTGKGLLILDRENEYPVFYDLDVMMNLGVKKDELSIAESLSMHSLMQVRILPQ